jgi:class 3 adenylate cyclase
MAAVFFSVLPSPTVSVPSAIHPVSLRFRDEQTEQEYRRASARGFLRPFRLVWSVAALLFASGIFIDFAIMPRQALGRVELIRFATVSIFLVAVTFAFLRPAAFERWWQVVTTTAGAAVHCSMLAMAVVIGTILPVTMEQTLLATLAAVFVITTIYTIAMLGFWWATTLNWLATLGYSVVVGVFAPTPAAIGYSIFWLFAANIGGMTGCYILERYRRLEFHGRRLLAAERAKSEALLLNILPAAIAGRLREDVTAIADRFDAVTILFADIAGFTDLSQRMSPEEVVALLNRMFTAFDELAEKHGLEKIKTIGDAYMVAGGLPERREDHAEAVAEMALGMRDAVVRLGAGHVPPLGIRIGVNTGPVVAGVIGKKKFIYDLWGDAVNTASRMESHGLIGEIQVSEATYLCLRDKFVLDPRGEIAVKGKGGMKTWFLRARGPAS